MSFLIALALTVVIYLCAYFMLFIGYIVLVLKHPDLKRTFNIPGGKGVKLVVAIVGLLTSIMAFIVSFLPPDNIRGDSTDMYVELLVVSFLVVLALPFILYAVHDRKGKANKRHSGANQQSERTKRSLLPAPACTFTTLYCDE